MYEKKYSQDTSTYRYLVIRRWAWEKNKKVVRFLGDADIVRIDVFPFLNDCATSAGFGRYRSIEKIPISNWYRIGG